MAAESFVSPLNPIAYRLTEPASEVALTPPTVPLPFLPFARANSATATNVPVALQKITL